MIGTSVRDPILEVIACTVDDAVEAERGGADRLELISRVDVGGLTPSADLVREIKAAVALPLRVMLRESEGFGISGNAEVERLCDAARAISEIGVDGLVLGFLREREVDLDLTARVLASALHVKATFHHAFEDARDQLAAIAAVKALPQVDRILAHGGGGSWDEKARRLGSYADEARPEIEILAGGGLDAAVIAMLRAGTMISEFHIGTAARTDGRVDRTKVARIVDLLRGDAGPRER